MSDTDSEKTDSGETERKKHLQTEESLDRRCGCDEKEIKSSHPLFGQNRRTDTIICLAIYALHSMK